MGTSLDPRRGSPLHGITPLWSPRKDTRPPWPGPTNPSLGRSQTHLAPLDLPPELLDALRTIVQRALLGEQPDERLLKTGGVSAALRRPPARRSPLFSASSPPNPSPGAAGSTDRSPGAAGTALPARSPLPPFAFVSASRPAPAPPSAASTAARGRWKAGAGGRPGPAQPRPVPHHPHPVPPNSPPLSTHPPRQEHPANEYRN